MRERGEVVDDVRRRLGDRRARRPPASSRSSTAGGAGARARRRRRPRRAVRREMDPANPDAPVMRTRAAQARRGPGRDQVLRRPCPFVETVASSIGAATSSGGLSRRSSSPEHGAEQQVAPRGLRERAAGAPQLREALAAGWTRVERPRCRARSRGARRGRPAGRAARAGPAATARRWRRPRRRARRWRGAARRRRAASASPTGDPAAEQLGVVVGDAEDALVERLLRGPHRGGRGAGEGAAQGPGRGRHAAAL